MPVFTANIPGTLKVGDKIEIGGKIKENARKMSVNLCAQEGEEPRDVVLHFDVRFHRDNIISLSRKNGIWIGSGNYDTNYNMFVPGTIFRIIFEVKDPDVITIYCQGKFHSNFLPKIPLTMARYIVAWADVERITHCFFHFSKSAAGDEAMATVGCPYVQVARANLVPDTKRCQRSRKKAHADTPRHQSSNESSDDEIKGRGKTEGRADRFFYDTLMCQTEQVRGGPSSPHKACYGRKYRELVSDTEKNETEGFSEEVASRNMDSSAVESEMLPEIGMKRKNMRHNQKMLNNAQVINFMGKTTKRN